MFCNTTAKRTPSSTINVGLKGDKALDSANLSVLSFRLEGLRKVVKVPSCTCYHRLCR